MQQQQQHHHHQTQDEEAIAQAILKRAEIARITRQLKSKLLKAKNKTESSSSSSSSYSSSNSTSASSSSIEPSLKSSQPILPTPPASQNQITKKRSRESLYQSNNTSSNTQLMDYQDEYETDEYESPTKKSNNNNIPSSPLYTIGETAPSTPPRKNATLSSSSNSMDLLSTPKSKVINNRNLSNFKTPTSTTSHKVLYPNKTPIEPTSSSKKKKFTNTPGHAAELLMFFANSPSPAAQPAAQSRKVLPTTPKRLFNNNNNDTSFLNSTPPTSAGIAAANALGSTPFSSSQHARTVDLFGNNSHKLSHPVTPGKKGSSFVLNDFVTSVFTPSPRR